MRLRIIDKCVPVCHLYQAHHEYWFPLVCVTISYFSAALFEFIRDVAIV